MVGRAPHSSPEGRGRGDPGANLPATVKFRVVVVGRSRVGWANEAVGEWTKRLRRLGGVGEQVVRSEPFRGDADRVRRCEGERLLRTLSPRDRLVVLDERGETLDSAAFAKLVDQGRQAGTVVFALGGAYGHDEQVRRSAWRVVRLSSMVLNHEVARVVLYEQLYRAMTLCRAFPTTTRFEPRRYRPRLAAARCFFFAMVM